MLPHLKKVFRIGERLAVFLRRHVQVKRRKPVYSKIKRCEHDEFTLRDPGVLNDWLSKHDV